MSEYTDLQCGSSTIARAVKAYLDNEMFEGEEDPPTIRAYVEKSTLRIEYVDAGDKRQEYDGQLLGYRDGYDARERP